MGLEFDWDVLEPGHCLGFPGAETLSELPGAEHSLCFPEAEHCLGFPGVKTLPEFSWGCSIAWAFQGLELT